MRVRHIVRWSNAVLASAAMIALTACGGGGSGETEDPQGKPAATASSPEPSDVPSASPSESASASASESADSSSGEAEEEAHNAKLPKVTEAKVTETAEGDRVTFTFSGPAPDHLDTYEEELANGEGRPINIRGSKFLRIAFVGASPDSRFASPAGNERVMEVRHLWHFEGELSVGIGIAAPDGAPDPAYDITTKGKQIVVDIKD